MDTTLEKVRILLAVREAARPARRAAFSLALPLLVFLIVTFVAPIVLLLFTAVNNPEPRAVIPQTLAALERWDGKAMPEEAVFATLARELAQAQQDRTAALLGKRLNYEIPGMRSRVVSAARMALANPNGPYRERFLALDAEWGSVAVWAVIKRNAGAFTPYFILSAIDLQQAPDGSLQRVEPDQRVFLIILGRTLFVAFTVTLLTLVLGYPVAYLLTVAPTNVARIMMLCVLLPLWTSLLVRTTAWVVLLQTDGVINDALLALGLTDHRLQLIFSRFGTVAAMTHIQLPFTILPIYSVMKAIPPTQLRAARSLGAGPLASFWKIYAPQTVPGVMAGGLITFILSLGYYITPALVGGPGDQMVSNFISIYINRDLNWGLASALGVTLLAVTIAIYLVFLRLVGAEKLRMG